MNYKHLKSADTDIFVKFRTLPPENGMSNLKILTFYFLRLLAQYYTQKVGNEPLKRISRYETSNIAENKVFTY